MNSMRDADGRGVGVKKQKKTNRRMGITRFTGETERALFFYATVAMFLLYALSEFLGG
jgi:hypothetical protein